ncbi:TadE family protein [Streptomyces tsukubensis]|uniref:TadE family protein n=1 Tax=Streptomyces tsukubensis TaxID=83656 RepID=UPI0036B1AA80
MTTGRPPAGGGVGIEPAPVRVRGRHPEGRPSPQRPAARDRGQAAVEYAGVLSLLVFVALAAIQIGLVAYTAQQAGTAARAAARTEATLDGTGRGPAAGRAAISGWLADGARFDPGTCSGEDDEVSVTVVVEVPSLLPVFDFDPAVRTVTMPCD